MRGGAVAELVWDEEATLAADAHAVEAGVHSDDDLALVLGTLRTLLEGKSSPLVRVFVGGIELGAIDEVAGVFDGVPVSQDGERSTADLVSM